MKGFPEWFGDPFFSVHLLKVDRTYSGVARDIVCIRRAKIAGTGEKVKLRFIMDKNSVELFVNDGEMALSTVIYTPLKAQEIRFIKYD